MVDLWNVAINRAAQQSDSEQTRSEIRDGLPRGRKRHGLPEVGETMAGMVKPAVQKPKQQIQAFAVKRKGGGWVMLTILCDEACVVDESDVDSRQAVCTRVEQQFRRLE